MRKNKGITLIALIITIVVMLILVAVSIRIIINSNLLGSAEKAAKGYQAAYEDEQNIDEKINVGDQNLEEYLASLSGDGTVDWETLFATAEKHPDQEYSDDIGIAEDGSIVNMDLWIYRLNDDGKSWNLNGSGGSVWPAYTGEIIEGKIQGKVPMYIKEDSTDGFYPVTRMFATFYYINGLTTAPEIPSTVTYMGSTFEYCRSLTTAPTIPNGVTDLSSTFRYCTSLTTAPEIPSSVTYLSGTFYECANLTAAPTVPDSVVNMHETFRKCTSLTTAPTIPSSVTDMNGTFYGCTSLTTAPAIPSSVTDMMYTFDGCTGLTGTVTINANPTSYILCFYECATNDGCSLTLTGDSTMLDTLAATGTNIDVED